MYEKLGEEFQKIALVYYHASVNNLFKKYPYSVNPKTTL